MDIRTLKNETFKALVHRGIVYRAITNTKAVKVNQRMNIGGQVQRITCVRGQKVWADHKFFGTKGRVELIERFEKCGSLVSSHISPAATLP